MEILFIIDSVDNIDKKISLLDEFGADIKFFVDAKYATKIMKNKNILNRIQAIYNNNINDTIDKYLKLDAYQPKSTLLYHSSAHLTKQLIDQIREMIGFSPSTIYIKKKFGLWARFKLWFYQKLVKQIFGFEDANASTKLQYFSAEMMKIYAETNFKNHVFKIPSSLTVEIEKEDEKSYYAKSRFNKNQLYNPIVLCLILICYVIIEKFLVLPFWTYLLLVALILLTIVNWIVMLIKGDFDIRYKK